jgi:4-amino-4-deoxy-L-arabinose transferase-like glycosyltransferase
MNQKSVFYFLFLFWLGAFLLILSPQLFSEGMFMDGVYYATIARNMAEGLGSFWDPTFTRTLGAHFYDHPPLAFGLQSLWFKLFGDHLWVERAYSLSTYLLCAAMMLIGWKHLEPKSSVSFGFIALFLWLSIPKVIWGASNNLLENTSMLFILGSILLQISYLKSKNAYWKLVLAGALLFAGFLTKGFTALFPLSFIFFYLLLQKRWKPLLISYLSLSIGLITPLLLLWVFSKEGILALENYLNIQVIASLKGAQSVDSRFYILRRFFEEMAVILILCALVWGVGKYVFKKEHHLENPYFLPLIFCGLSGVLPIMISMKQSTFYIIPTFPLFCLAAAIWLKQPLQSFFKNKVWNPKQLKTFQLLSLIVLSLGVYANNQNIGKLKRDKAKLEDIRTIRSVVAEHGTITLNPELYREWGNYAYFFRYGHISFSKETQEFLLSAKDQKPSVEGQYLKLDLGLNTFDLYQKKPN